MPDLSHVYAGNADDGQREHDNMPDYIRKHMMKAFAHKAGLLKEHPGQAPIPPDWTTPESNYAEGQQSQQEAIDKLASTSAHSSSDSSASAPVSSLPSPPSSPLPGLPSGGVAE